MHKAIGNRKRLHFLGADHCALWTQFGAHNSLNLYNINKIPETMKQYRNTKIDSPFDDHGHKHGPYCSWLHSERVLSLESDHLGLPNTVTTQAFVSIFSRDACLNQILNSYLLSVPSKKTFSSEYGSLL